MIQGELGLLGRIDAAGIVPHSAIVSIKTYRDAVRASWVHRRSQRMTRATLAELTGMYPQHVSDYLADTPTDRKGAKRRDMPAEYIKAFEATNGNKFVSQWLAWQAGLTVLQSLIADQQQAA